MKLKQKLQDYGTNRRIAGPMPAFVELNEQSLAKSTYEPMQVCCLELKLYCEYTQHVYDETGLARRRAEAHIMHMLYGDVIKAAYNIESRLMELGVWDQKVREMLADLQRVEV